GLEAIAAGFGPERVEIFFDRPGCLTTSTGTPVGHSVFGPAHRSGRGNSA
ncbi:unnamed protein product, partial [Musa textilis]